jgi:hypothetical protein
MRTRFLSLAVFVRGNGISSVETKAPKPSLKFLRQRQSAPTRKDLTSGVFAPLPGTTSEPIARCSEQATNNRLVGSSSPPSPTTQSQTKQRFPGVVQIVPNWWAIPGTPIATRLPRVQLTRSRTRRAEAHHQRRMTEAKSVSLRAWSSRASILRCGCLDRT